MKMIQPLFLDVFKKSVYNLKPKFQDGLRPVLVILMNRGATPNGITISALILSVFFGASLFFSHFSKLMLLLFPFFLFFRMALNALDGMLAVQTHQTSPVGAFLNEVCDIGSDLGIYFPFLFCSSIHPILLSSLLLLTVVSEFVGIAALVTLGKRRFEGPFGKSDRAVFFGLIAIALVIKPASSIYFDGLLILGIILSLLTIYHRSRSALVVAKE